jgi:hypothetical protein
MEHEGANMNASTITAVGLCAWLLAGCETLSGPQAVANADAQRHECQNVVVTSTADELRLQNRGDTATDEMKRTEGTLALGRIRANEPRALRNPIAPEESLTSRALREC